MMEYKCPYDEYVKRHKIYMCKKRKKEGVDYTIYGNILSAMCMAQVPCTCPRGIKHSTNAEWCYNYMKKTD